MVLEGVRGTRPDVGVPGRLDHFAYDPATGRLFVAALENGSLEVLDLETGRRVKSITGLSQPQGLAIIPGQSLVALACGGDGKLHVYDMGTLEEKRTVDVGPDADNVRYDQATDTLYVSCGDDKGGAIVAFETKQWQKLRQTTLPSKPESFQLESNSPRLFANLPGGTKATRDGIVCQADRNTGKVEKEITLKGIARNFPMALDQAHGRLFVACRRPARLIVLDTRDLSVLAQAACGEDSDDLFYDAPTGRVQVICGGFRPDMEVPTSGPAIPAANTDQTGTIEVFATGPGGQPTKIAVTRTAPHARTGLFVPQRRAIYVGVPPVQGRDPEIREYRLPLE